MESKIAETRVAVKLREGKEIPVMEIYSEELEDRTKACEQFILKINPKTGKPVYSLHPDSKVTRLFNFFKVNTFQELIGKPITIAQRKNGWGFEY